MEIISMDLKVFNALVKHIENMEEKVEALYSRQQDLGLKRWLNDQDICEILNITKRTLQTYRENGLLPYSRIKYKVFYRPADVEKLLQSSHHSKT
jgi:hypothetical protein